MKRMSTVAIASMLLLGLMVGPAGATAPDAGGNHKITICHATNSASNPYVVITIDEAAWVGGTGAGHGPDRHMNRKTGDADKPWNALLGCREPGGTSVQT